MKEFTFPVELLMVSRRVSDRFLVEEPSLTYRDNRVNTPDKSHIYPDKVKNIQERTTIIHFV